MNRLGGLAAVKLSPIIDFLTNLPRLDTVIRCVAKMQAHKYREWLMEWLKLLVDGGNLMHLEFGPWCPAINGNGMCLVTTIKIDVSE